MIEQGSYSKLRWYGPAVGLGLAAVLCAACSGGGGGGGEGRTRETAVRLVHGSIDGSPLEVRVVRDGETEQQFIQKAVFAEVTEYVPVERGKVTINVDRANSPGVRLSELHVELESETEYTLFAAGQARDGHETTVLIPEPVEQPDRGFARVQILNALEGGSSLLLDVGGVRTGPAAFGSASGYVDVPSGPQTVVITNSRGAEIAGMEREIADRGELTFLVCGSDELGVRFVRVYEDLD